MPAGARASGRRPTDTGQVIDPLQLVSALARRVGRAAPTEPLIARMCRAVVDLLDVDGGSVTCAATEDGRSTVCVTDAVARQIGQIEEVTGEGPTIEAFRRRCSVGVLVGLRAGRLPAAPTAQDAEHPMFAAALGDAAQVQTRGAVEVRAWPVRAGGVPVAVLTLYSRGQFRRPLPVAEGQVLADALSGAVGGTGSGAAVLAAEAERRARVHRAVGMVVAQTGLPPRDALALLRARAFAGTTTLDVVAGEVLDRRVEFSGDPTR